MDDLKKRAYLARFLVKIEVAPDIEIDNDIHTLYQQVRQAILNSRHYATISQVKWPSESLNNISLNSFFGLRGFIQ